MRGQQRDLIKRLAAQGMTVFLSSHLLAEVEELGSSHGRYRRRTAGGELLRVIREEHSGPELEAKEQTLEQLRWRLAALARRLATDDFGAAA